jgi:Tfp pilus assembly protein PilF
MLYRALSFLVVALVCSLGAAQSLSTFGNGSVTGRCSTIAGQPVADARIELRTVDTGRLVASGYSAPNGSFELNNVPRGTYEISAAVNLSETRERVDVSGMNVMVNLRLPTSQQVEGGDSHSVSVGAMQVPKKARKEFKKAREAMEEQKLDAAKEHLAKALEIHPSFAEALTVRAVLLMDEKNTGEALAAVQKAIESDPNFPTAYIVMGAVLNLLAKYEDALRALDRGVALAPTAWQAYFELGKTWLGKGDFAAAVRQLDRAEQFAPKTYAPIYLVKAHAFIGLKEWEHAIQAFQSYLERDPAGPDSTRAREDLNKVRAFAATK